jgi:DNA primase
MKFSNEFIERVQDSINLVDHISQYTVLKPAAGGYMGRCPFPDHQEKTPSFSVSEMKQVYHCFGCGKKGNLFTFLQTYNGMNFPDAVEYLADRASIPLPVNESGTEEDRQNRLKREKKKSIFEANSFAKTHFQSQLKSESVHSDVKKYIQKRKMSEQILEEFHIGYSSESWDQLTQLLKNKKSIGGFDALSLAEEAKLIKRRKGDDGYFDMFRDRLMFPILLPTGDVVGFGGRIIVTGEPKYLNSPETPVFHKGKILYGLYQTAKHIRSEDQAIIVEGYMDLIALYQSGIKNVAASMGTALTPEQAGVLGKMTKNIVVLFDGDSAGQEAIERSLPVLLHAGLYPKGVVLPDQFDPDEYLQEKGLASFQQQLSQASELFSLVLQKWLVGYQGLASEKVKICDLAKPVLEQMSDQRLKKLYVTELAQRLQATEIWVTEAIFGQSGATKKTNSYQRSAIADVQPRDLDQQNAPSGPRKLSLKGAPNAEIELLRAAIKTHANFELWRVEGNIEEITHPVIKRVLQRAIDDYGQSPEKFDKLPSLLINFIEEAELFTETDTQSDLLNSLEANNPSLQLQTKKVESGTDQPNLTQFLRDAIKKVKLNHLKIQLITVQKELAAGPSAAGLEKLNDLQKLMTEMKH